MEKYREKRKAWQDANWRRYMLRRVCRTCSDEFTQDPRSRAMDRCTGCRRLDKMQVELWSPPAVTVIPGAFWHAGRCRVCDAAFVSQHADVTCSTVCRRLRQKPSLGSKDWISREDRRGVYVRDAFICQLCSEPVDQDADPLSNRYPSLDHIVPRSQGGDDALSNLQTAHRICNSRRRDMSVAEYRGRYLQAA
jgi:5-methylcytosine-specific restriction endonuclease McrA